MEPSRSADEWAKRVIEAALTVHRALGPGFLESIYEAALAIELESRGISIVRQAPISIVYMGQSVGEGRVDFLVGGELIVELKAVDALAPIHTAQVISYLQASKLQLGLLINFNVPLLKDGVKHVVLSQS